MDVFQLQHLLFQLKHTVLFTMPSWEVGCIPSSQRLCWYVAPVVQLLAIFETAKASRGGPSLQLSWVKFYKEDLEIYKSSEDSNCTRLTSTSLYLKTGKEKFVDLVILRKKRKFDNNTLDHYLKLAKHRNLVLKVSLRRRVETCDILCHMHNAMNYIWKAWLHDMLRIRFQNIVAFPGRNC